MPYLRLVLLAAAVVYGITAWFSQGHYHADEHYQILEFADGFLNDRKAEDLVWEYGAQIRPTVQPMIAAGVRLCSSDWHQTAFWLRLLSAGLTVLVVVFFWRRTRHEVPFKWQAAYLALSLFLWFEPVLGVRFSSENWGGLWLLLGLGLVWKSGKSATWWWAGICMGLAFAFRFQMAVAVGAWMGWWLWHSGGKWRLLLPLLAGVGITLVGLVVCDRFFYGTWVCTPWNYFAVNLLEGKAADFGVSPGYMYLWGLWKQGFFPISIAMLVCAVGAWVVCWRHPLSWIMAGFVGIHLLLAHKEFRFLFPLVHLLPLWFLTWMSQWDMARWSPLKSQILKVLGVCLVVCNLGALAVCAVKPMGVGREAMARTFMEESEYTHVVALGSAHPLQGWKDLPNHCFRVPHIGATYLEASAPLPNWSSIAEGHVHPVLAVRRRFAQDRYVRSWLKQNGLERVAVSLPPSLERWTRLYGTRPGNIIELYSLNPECAGSRSHD